ncbi:MAG TPA: DUF3189 family protein [Firmicutes bacterium]|nr:DUF3189 family protein [Candidatus Fermentithermobacillaceae bacterium]
MSVDKLVLAKTKEGAMREAGLEESDPGVSFGSRGLAAGRGTTFCAWGVVPSPLAMKVAENVLGVCGSEGGDRDGGKRVVIYACYAGTHTSILAACIHLGLFKDGCDVCDLPFFDKRNVMDIGVPVLLGKDEHGAEVYALGTGWLSAPLEQAVCDLVELAYPRVRLCICSVRGFLDLQARLGGFASRRFRLVFPGRRLVASSLVRKVPYLKCAVRECLDLSSRWKDNEGQSEREVVWLDGSKAGRVSEAR